MSQVRLNNRLDRPVDEAYVLGPADAQITLVEYGSYACPHRRAANEQIAGVRDRFGDRLRYVALCIPTRPPANLKALATQASTIIAAEGRRVGDVLRHGPSLPAMRALDDMHDRLESPADRLLRHVGALELPGAAPVPWPMPGSSSPWTWWAAMNS